MPSRSSRSIRPISMAEASSSSRCRKCRSSRPRRHLWTPAGADRRYRARGPSATGRENSRAHSDDFIRWRTMQEVNFLTKYQKATKRDYVGRVVEHDKAECATVAKQWGADYWDGPRQYGYGGNKYDGRWLPIAEDIARHYGLKAGDRVLDVGCGKAFLL